MIFPKRDKDFLFRLMYRAYMSINHKKNLKKLLKHVNWSFLLSYCLVFTNRNKVLLIKIKYLYIYHRLFVSS
jgi:hypothetical protein